MIVARSLTFLLIFGNVLSSLVRKVFQLRSSYISVSYGSHWELLSNFHWKFFTTKVWLQNFPLEFQDGNLKFQIEQNLLGYLTNTLPIS